MFCQPNGLPLDPHRDWEEWRDLLAEADIPHTRLYNARHTMATLLLEQGVPLRVVMEMLGHSTIQLTSDTYSHVAPPVIRDAADRMGAALWPQVATKVAPAETLRAEKERRKGR